MPLAPRLHLHNGFIWTGRPGRPWAVAMDLEHGRVSRIWEDGSPEPRFASRPRPASKPASVAGTRQPGPERLDLGGRAVLPGLTDAHVHFLPWARRRGGADLGAARDWPAIEAILRRAAAGLGSGEWLLASGLHPEVLEPERPSRELLDRLGAERPVYVRTHDTHGAWVSSEALRRAGVVRPPPDPPDGRLERDASGELTGFVLEGATQFLRRAIPPLSDQAELEMLRSGQAEAHRLGLTCVHSFEGADEWTRLQQLREAGDLTLRVVHMFPLRELDAALSLGLRTGFGDHRLRLGCVKLFADGTLGLRTARMLEPYASGGTGGWLLPPEELKREAVRAAAGGIGVAIHAIGDAAVRASLDALQAARARNALVPLRVEHAQIVSPADLPRFAALRVTASMQPIHFTTDLALAEREWGARCATAYAWGPLARAGARLIFGTDAPIEPLSPWPNLAAALGHGAFGEGPSFDVGRALAFPETLRASTRGPWEAMGWGGGELAPGARADVIVVDRGPEELERGPGIEHARVELTLAGGVAVHASGVFQGKGLEKPPI